MTELEFKRKLFIHIIESDYQYLSYNDVSELVNRIHISLDPNLVTEDPDDLRIKDEADYCVGNDNCINNDELEDVSCIDITLPDAVEKLSMSLRYDGDLYESYVSVLEEEIQKESKGSLSFNARNIAINYFDRFIEDVEANKNKK